MKYLSLLVVLIAYMSCTNTDTTAGGKPIDSTQAAMRDSLANITRPTPFNLDSSVQRFLAFNKAMQFDSVANYIYPTVYKYLPKSQVVQGLSILKILEGIDIRMDSANVLRMDSIARFSSGEATRMDYVMKLSVIIRDTGIGKQVTPEVRNMIIGGLKSSLGTDNVRYNDTTRTIGAVINRQALAINDTVSKGWKFIALENNQHLRDIVPVEIRDRYLSTQPLRDTTKKDTFKMPKRIE